MKALKAFIKPFKAPQRSTKIKIKLIFSLRLGSGREGLKPLQSWLLYILLEAYSEPCQISKVKLFAKKVTGSKLLTFLAKSSILDV